MQHHAITGINRHGQASATATGEHDRHIANHLCLSYLPIGVAAANQRHYVSALLRVVVTFNAPGQADVHL
jgi:hypothetical protein